MKPAQALLASLALGLLLLGGCASEAKHADAWAGVHQLVAVVSPTQGNNAHGVVRFTQVDGGVRIVADIEGLTPNAHHAFHIHEFGDVTSSNGTSAGGHFNPEKQPHGHPEDAMRHAGDLGNLTADATGRAHYERVDTHISLTGMMDPIVGRAVVVHAGEDKFTQPVGDAGGRIAYGVIGVAKVEAPPAAK
jgi:Cu-Zn family superoxide dismutase